MCQNITQDWWQMIDLKRFLIKVKKGQKFIEEGNEMSGVYFIQDGFVKVHKHWEEREMIVRFGKKGDIVGHRGISTANFFLQFLPRQ
jgi:CRP-like cAMP-binding protein